MLSIFMKKLTVNEAKNKVTTSDNAVLIDCRPKEDYAHGHVAGAINFPIRKNHGRTCLPPASGTNNRTVYYRKLLPQTKRCHEEILKNSATKIFTSADLWKNITAC